MSGFPWVIAGIAVGIILIGVLVIVLVRRRRIGEDTNVNYRSFFILGVCFLPTGIAFEVIHFTSDITAFLVMGLSFIAMGGSYIAIGLANRDKWQQP